MLNTLTTALAGAGLLGALVDAKSSSNRTSSKKPEVKSASVKPYSPYALSTDETLNLKQSFDKDNFWDGFYFQTNADLGSSLDGQMVYVDQQTAFNQGLAYSTDDSVILRADNTNWLDYGAGRNSVRINSNQKFNIGSLLIVDFKHVPAGYSTWPAFWSTGDDWPSHGEIDIYEGSNAQPNNMYSIHTTNGCSLTSKLISTGTIRTTDCSGWDSDNQGCSYNDGIDNSYGKGLNDEGGATFAVLFDLATISIWRFPYEDSLTRGENVDMSQWSNPVAVFTSSNGCNIQDYFQGQTLVMNIGICGSLPEGTWSQYGPQDGSQCADYVTDPSTYDDAYFEITNLRVYAA